jgi:hypothetical protein
MNDAVLACPYSQPMEECLPPDEQKITEAVRAVIR